MWLTPQQFFLISGICKSKILVDTPDSSLIYGEVFEEREEGGVMVSVLIGPTVIYIRIIVVIFRFLNKYRKLLQSIAYYFN